MTVKAYLALDGLYCPHCGSSQIGGGSIDIGSGQTSQRLRCPDCDASWVDVYVLSNMCDLEVG
jgi:transposase-like protein